MSSYDELYTINPNVFGSNPSEEVVKILEFKAKGMVLDIGAGNGRNSIYLAENGFNVVAVEPSKVAVDYLQNICNKKEVSIDIIHNSILEYKIPSKLDVVVNSLALHHLPYLEAENYIKKLQEHTVSKGLHVFDVITKNSDFYQQMKGKKLFYVERSELIDLYPDWNVLFEKKSKWQAAKDSSSVNNSLKIIFQKN